MRVDKGVAVILKKGDQYGILKRDKNWSGWEIPKGHLELGSHDATVLVELYEEAGIKPVDIRSMKQLDQKLEFEFEEEGEKRISSFQVYLVEVEDGTSLTTDMNPSEEHVDSMFTSKEKALDLLEYEDQKELLRSHESFL